MVVVAAISQHQSPLALGNILGSSISNILGAFSLGLIFSPSAITFDKSAKIYTGVLLSLTTFFTLFILFFEGLGRFGGILLITTFVAYIASIAWAIYNGIVAPPEDSDSDSDSNSDSSSDSDDERDHDEESFIPLKSKKSSSQLSLGSAHSNATTLHEEGQSPKPTSPRDAEFTPLAPEIFADAEAEQAQTQPLTKDLFDNISLSNNNLESMTRKPGARSTTHHIFHLIFGFLALSLSGYILSHSVTTIANSFSLSSTILGTTLLSLATTLPEKLVSIFSSRAGQHGIVIANTAGSNIFLVTLCAGVLFTAGDLSTLRDSVTLFEVVSMWVSSAVLFGIVVYGGKKWMGWVLFAFYILFIVGEFTVDRR